MKSTVFWISMGFCLGLTFLAYRASADEGKKPASKKIPLFAQVQGATIDSDTGEVVIEKDQDPRLLIRDLFIERAKAFQALQECQARLAPPASATLKKK